MLTLWWLLVTVKTTQPIKLKRADTEAPVMLTLWWLLVTVKTTQPIKLKRADTEAPVDAYSVVVIGNSKDNNQSN